MKVEVSIEELEELKRKARAYDKMIAKRAEGARKANSNMTPEQRTARAKKAAQARVDKMRKKD